MFYLMALGSYLMSLVLIHSLAGKYNTVSASVDSISEAMGELLQTP